MSGGSNAQPGQLFPEAKTILLEEAALREKLADEIKAVSLQCNEIERASDTKLQDLDSG